MKRTLNYSAILLTCLISIALWGALIAALALASNWEMIACRPFHDPDYRIIETTLESRMFLGKRFTIPMKDLMW